MSAPTLSLAQACAQMQLSAPACAQLSTPITPQAAVSALLASGHGEDAIKLLARLLPKRYAVAWLCQCVRGETLDEEDRAGAALAEVGARAQRGASSRRAGICACRRLCLAGRVAGCGSGLVRRQPGAAATDHAGAAGRPSHGARGGAAITLLAAREPAQLEARRSGYAAHAMELLTSVGAP